MGGRKSRPMKFMKESSVPSQLHTSQTRVWFQYLDDQLDEHKPLLKISPFAITMVRYATSWGRIWNQGQDTLWRSATWLSTGKLRIKYLCQSEKVGEIRRESKKHENKLCCLKQNNDRSMCLLEYNMQKSRIDTVVVKKKYNLSKWCPLTASLVDKFSFRARYGGLCFTHFWGKRSSETSKTNISHVLELVSSEAPCPILLPMVRFHRWCHPFRS